MSQTVFITGASTGIGHATALLFQQRGWNVVATMRSPEKSDLQQLDNVLCLPLDVTKPEMISPTIAQAIERFGAIDGLVNNAGYGLVGAFEACSPEEIRRQFETNVFGLMAMTRALLPHFRDRQQGVILNVTSVGGKMALPFYSSYNSTKWAVEGWSEALQYELRSFNIRVKLIEPGPIKTDFYGRSINVASNPELMVYEPASQQAIAQLEKISVQSGSAPEVTAQVIYQAAIDRSWRLRYPAGGNAGLLLGLRKGLPDWLWMPIMRKLVMKSWS
ncbi:MAG: SDR family oxidoreductase [Synechococcales bacterium]|nr:SDR family oxidoreductase [Synechococcales bacterium]